MLCPKIAILTPPPVWLSSFRKYSRSKVTLLGCDTNIILWADSSMKKKRIFRPIAGKKFVIKQGNHFRMLHNDFYIFLIILVIVIGFKQ